MKITAANIKNYLKPFKISPSFDISKLTTLNSSRDGEEWIDIIIPLKLNKNNNFVCIKDINLLSEHVEYAFELYQVFIDFSGPFVGFSIAKD